MYVYIKVRKRRKAEPPDVAADDDNFYKDMRELLDDEEHMDAKFLVHKDSTNSVGNDDMEQQIVEVRAHKSVLTARAAYFKAFFRTNAYKTTSDNKTKTTTGGLAAFRESEECIVNVSEPMFNEQHIRYVLEFIYTNRINRIRDISTDDLLCLLQLADKWLLRDMKRIIEHELIREHMSITSVARMYGATEQFSAKRLSHACIEFIMNNLRQLATNTIFIDEMQNYPHLCIPVLKAAAELIADGPLHKKQRIDHNNHHNSNNTNTAGTPSNVSGLRSSPVPDSDT